MNDMSWLMDHVAFHRFIPKLRAAQGRAETMLRVCSVAAILLVMTLSGGPLPAAMARQDDPGLQAAPFYVRSFKVENGLPLSHVRMIAQTRDGYLWLGAEHDGLARFDGVRFSSPGGAPGAPEPYPGHKDLSALLAGSDGSLWVGTPGGLWRLLNNRWEHFTTHNGLSNDGITTLHEDDNHDLWVGTTHGLNRIRGASIRVFSEVEGLSSEPITAIQVDNTGDLWVGTATGELQCLHDEKFTAVPRLPAQSQDPINSLLRSRDGTLWIGSWDGGLGRMTGKTIRVNESGRGLMNGAITALAEDRWGTIWIGTQKGIFFAATGENADDRRIDRIGYATTHALLQDREGAIWSGTSSGLHQYKDWRLRVYAEEAGFADRNICSVLAARSGGLWVGMNGGGVARFKNGAVIAKYGVGEGLSSNDVTSILERRDGTLWVGNWGEGLNHLENGKFEPVPDGGGTSNNIVRSLFEDKAGDLWVGTWGSGLRRLHDGRFTTYTTRDRLADDHVRVIEQDRDGNLWIATQGGLCRFRDGSFTTFTTRDGLSEDSIFALRADPDGSLWIGTWGGGLNRLRDGRFTAYTTRVGLPCDTICEILDDGAGNLWLGSIKGIIRVSKDNLSAFDNGLVSSIHSASYDMADGMNSAQCNRGTQPSGCRTDDGRLWFATINGVVMIDPNTLPTNELPPTVILEQVFSDDHAVGSSRSLKLPATRGEIRLQYTATSLLAPEKVRFRYKLEGYNVHWVEARDRREVQYANLPPGSYKFLVSAGNGDGIWGPPAKLLDLTIAPPFYLSGAFLMACSLLTMAAAAGAYWLWMDRVRRRERALVVLVERRTAEARAAQETAEKANRAKDRFIAVLSHELRTPLTPVLLSVDCLLDDDIAPLAREHLEMIRRNVELEARLVDDLLDVSRIERDQFKLDLQVVDVHQAIGRAVEVCSGEVRKRGLNVVRQLGAQSHHVQGDYARLIQIFWNLIHNAAKFTPYGGTLTLASYNEDPADGTDAPLGLVVEFQDTGAGIEPGLLERIFDPFEQGSYELRDRAGGLGLGLAISRGVAEAHGGHLTALSAGPGKGSTFRLQLAVSTARKPDHAPAQILDQFPNNSHDLKILLVEDNADALRYLRVVLERHGHSVTPAASLTAARLAAAAASHDLLISDIELPDGTGLELMRELSITGLPGIALSGYGSDDDLRQSRDAGFAAHLVKPVIGNLLIQEVGRTMAQSRHTRRFAVPTELEASLNAAVHKMHGFAQWSAE